MSTAGIVLVAVAVLVGGYAYFGYPALLWILTRKRAAARAPLPDDQLPMLSITVPAYNETGSIAA